MYVNKKLFSHLWSIPNGIPISLPNDMYELVCQLWNLRNEVVPERYGTKQALIRPMVTRAGTKTAAGGKWQQISPRWQAWDRQQKGWRDDWEKDHVGKSAHKATVGTVQASVATAQKQQKEEQMKVEQWGKQRERKLFVPRTLAHTKAGERCKLHKVGSYTLWALNHVLISKEFLTNSKCFRSKAFPQSRKLA